MANNFERKETYKPNEILDFLPNPNDYPKGHDLKKIKRDYDGDMMKMGSQRYYTFAKSLCCDHCCREGVFMAKERHLSKKGEPVGLGAYHFNLYAVDPDGTEVLMTKDHIIPKSKGGKNVVSNYMTMCEPCNKEKRNKDETKAKQEANKRKEKGILLTIDQK